MEADYFHLILFWVTWKTEWHTLHRIKFLHCLQILFLLWTQIQSAAKQFSYPSVRAMPALLGSSRKAILNRTLKGCAAAVLLLFSLLVLLLTRKNSHADCTYHNTQLLKRKTKLVLFFVCPLTSSPDLPFLPRVDLPWLFLVGLFSQAHLWFVCFFFTDNSPPSCSGVCPCY